MTVNPTFHASANGSPFGPTLCGFKPEGDESVWVTQIQSDVNCHLCLDATAPAQEPPAPDLGTASEGGSDE